MKTKNNIITLDRFKDKNYGKPGTEKRDKLEEGFENFKIGALIHDARIEKGMTQEKTGSESWYDKIIYIKNRKQS